MAETSIRRCIEKSLPVSRQLSRRKPLAFSPVLPGLLDSDPSLAASKVFRSPNGIFVMLFAKFHRPVVLAVIGQCRRRREQSYKQQSCQPNGSQLSHIFFLSDFVPAA